MYTANFIHIINNMNSKAYKIKLNRYVVIYLQM